MTVITPRVFFLVMTERVTRLIDDAMDSEIVQTDRTNRAALPEISCHSQISECLEPTDIYCNIQTRGYGKISISDHLEGRSRDFYNELIQRIKC